MNKLKTVSLFLSLWIGSALILSATIFSDWYDLELPSIIAGLAIAIISMRVWFSDDVNIFKKNS